jgi:phosphoribosylaminoimidazole carboxylase (NCAIR synthetase)
MRRIGIIGGDQLGRMDIEEARKYLVQIEVLSPHYPSPASDLADVIHVGPLDDFESVIEFAEESDVVSFEIEHVMPSAGALAAIHDKARQKAMLDAAGIPTARW